LLKRFELPWILPERITTRTIMEKLARDKKFSSGAIRFVVLERLGQAKVVDTITTQDLEAAIAHLRS
jgi:3-dehydroquinate synthetase